MSTLDIAVKLTDIATVSLVAAETSGSRVNLQGQVPLVVGATSVYTITDYSSFSSYSVGVSSGSATIVGSNITVAAPASVGTVTLTVTKDGLAEVFSLPIAAAPVSGVQWNPTTDTYVRTGEGTTGNAHITVASQMKRCVLQSNGTVAYYLHPTDSTKRADGSAADLTGATGNVMVEIPKFYYKYEWTGTAHHWSIATTPIAGYTVHPAFIKAGVEVSYRYYHAYNPRDNGTKLISASGLYPTANQTRAQFRAKAAANGTGWSLVDWNLLFAVQVIYLVEYANLNSQATIGAGRTALSGGSWADGSYYALSGLSNSKGNGTFSVSNGGSAGYSTDYMTYRGIENWYGHLWKFIDGVNITERNYYVNNKPATFADDVFTGDYVLKGTAGSTSGYVSNFAQNGDGFFPTSVSGSTTTYTGDYYWQNTGNRVLLFGASADVGAAAGAFCLSADIAASYVDVSISAGLAY